MSRVTRSGTDSEARNTESEPRNASANRERSRTATRTRERRRNRLLGGLLIVGLWEFVGRLSAAGLGIAPPSSILVATVDLYASGAIYGPLVETVVRLLIGYALAVAVAVPVGAVMGVSGTLDELLGTYVTIMFMTSVASLLPFLIIVVGTGLGFYVAVVFLFCVFHMILTVRAGTANVDPGLVEAARTFGATNWRRYRYVLLPAALPFAIAALRIGFNRAVKGVVVAELWIYAGFGSLLHSYQRYAQADYVFAVVVHVMVIAVLGVRVLRWLEERYAGWEGGTS